LIAPISLSLVGRSTQRAATQPEKDGRGVRAQLGNGSQRAEQAALITAVPSSWPTPERRSAAVLPGHREPHQARRPQPVQRAL